MKHISLGNVVTSQYVINWENEIGIVGWRRLMVVLHAEDNSPLIL